MTALSVNVNKVATLRNSRGGNTPDVLQVSLDLIKFGAQGITVHPRPDGRHIRHADVHALKKAISVELNIEGYPAPEFLAMVEDVLPAQCTLVPDPPEALTSNAGWQVAANDSLLRSTVERLHRKGVRVSVFIDPAMVSAADFEALQAMKANRIELYTEAYATAFGTSEQTRVTKLYADCAGSARAHDLEVNAGHDLNLLNLAYLVHAIPFIAEVSIGHALISDALYLGFKEAVQRYRDCLKN